MYKDPEIMGLCGETTIANKKASWVTMIQVSPIQCEVERDLSGFSTGGQVFEYFISHHQVRHQSGRRVNESRTEFRDLQAKAFESSIHTVSCLPGCFSIYRLKVSRRRPQLTMTAMADRDVCAGSQDGRR